MSNRDYYGNDVPSHLAGGNVSYQSIDTQSPEFGAPQHHGQQWSNENPPLNQNQYIDPNIAEKGLGSTVVGGAGGAFVGHQVGKKSDHGTLGAIGGAIAGAVAANMASNMVKEHKHGNEQGHGHEHGVGGRLRERRRERLERKLDRLS